jgi:DNA-binding transcriptional LysR family regulator
VDRIDALKIFVRVAELGSFTRAAEALNVQKATTSAGVRQLEGDLGARLFHRTTRSVELTPDGRACHERAKDLLSDLEELHSMFRQSPGALTGRLRVDMPTSMAKNLILPRLPEFTRDHPELAIELSSTDRRVDLVREGFDCVLRVGGIVDSSLIAQALGKLRVITCASPGYLATHGVPRTLEDLQRHRLVHYAAALGAQPDGWEYWDGTMYRTVPMQGAITVNSADAYEAACIAGYGLIQVPATGMQRGLAEGKVVEVLQQYQAEPMPVSILYAYRRNLPLRVRRFMDWVTQVLRPHLEA